MPCVVIVALLNFNPCNLHSVYPYLPFALLFFFTLHKFKQLQMLEEFVC